ncbi:PREDICTED: uncharacterized protein LOC106925702 [Poecilia mexicana]|uniref:Uncharacterized protein n=1 Tax=Poecilia mexicana TaxID=48701 RepID=A0A3B3WU20_9TELE|nr:PREDICTED: uncharacterized protein LOC106925702 [Poecilia mexicana]
MPGERWRRLQRTLCQYVTDTLTYMATVKDFYEIFSEWKDCREMEYVKMMSIKEMADKIDPTFDNSEGKWPSFCKYVKSSLQLKAESKLLDLEKTLAEVLEDTLGGLEELNTFLDAVEKLAVTSLHVFTENQIIYLPEKISFDDVQAVISSAQQICPLILEFKRDAKTFFLPNLHNVEVLAFQLQNYIDTANRICVIHSQSSNFDICMEMAEEIAVNSDDLCENDMQKMTDQIKLLDKIRMDEDFRMEFLFQDVSSAGFISIFKEQQPKLLQFLDDVEQCAVQLEKMNKGAKISSITSSSVGAAGGVLSIVGLALIPVTAGVSVGLTIAGVTMGVTSGANSLVTTLTEVGVNSSQQKKANEVFGKFYEDFQKVQDSLDEVMKQVINLEQSNIEVLLGVVRSAHKLYTIGKGIDSIVDSADVGQAAVKGPLALTRGARAGFIALNVLFLGMDIFFIAKESLTLAKGSKTKVSKFLRARAALFRSQIESWEKICNSLCQSKLTKEENKNILQMAFLQDNK